MAGYLQKPNLHYGEFLAVLRKAGIELAGDEMGQGLGKSVD